MNTGPIWIIFFRVENTVNPLTSLSPPEGLWVCILTDINIIFNLFRLLTQVSWPYFRITRYFSSLIYSLSQPQFYIWTSNEKTCVCVISGSFLLGKYSDVKSASNLPAYSSQTPPPLLKGCLVRRVMTKSHADKSIQCLLVVLDCCFDIFCVQVRPSTYSCLHNSTTTCEGVFFDLQAV